MAILVTRPMTRIATHVGILEVRALPCSNSYCTATSTTTITTRPATTKPTMTTKCASKETKCADGKDYGPVAGVSGDPANGKDDGL